MDDSEEEMDDLGSDPYMNTSGWDGGHDSWDQMFSHLGEPAVPVTGGSKAAAAGSAATKAEGAVKKTVEKIHQSQKGMRDKLLAQAAKTCKRVTAGKPLESESLELGFPQIGENPEDY